MSSPGGGDDGVLDAEGSPFPAVDVDRELDPNTNKYVEVDPISSELAASLEEEERRKEEEKKRKEVKNKETMQTLKTAFIASGVIAAVAVAAFAITKKFRENN